MTIEAGTHVIFGTGPAAAATGAALLARGHAVRFVNRSGERDELLPQGAELVQADAADPSATRRAAGGATVIYNCLNVPYQHWNRVLPKLQSNLLTAARDLSARFIALENLYAYGNVQGALREDLPLRASTRKGSLRAEMTEALLAAHERGDVQVAIGRASDFYGPGVTHSLLGERAFRPLVRGRPALVFGDPDLPHSYAYVDDVGRGLAILGTESAALGEAWHLPHAEATTTREMLGQAFELAGFELQLRALGRWPLRLAGLLLPEARETVELLYEFEEPFVVDDSKFWHEFQIAPTSITTGIAKTVSWYQEHFA